MAIENEVIVPSTYYEHLFNCYESNQDFDKALVVSEDLMLKYSFNKYYKLLYLETLAELQKTKSIYNYIDDNKHDFDLSLVNFSLNFYIKNDNQNFLRINELFLIKEGLVFNYELIFPDHVRYLYKYQQYHLILALFSYQSNPIYHKFNLLYSHDADVQFDYKDLTVSQNLILMSIYENDKNIDSEAYKQFLLGNLRSIQSNDFLNQLYLFSTKMNFDDLSNDILSFSLNINPQNILVIDLYLTSLMKQGANKEAYGVVVSGLSYYPYQINLLLKQLYLSVFVSDKQYSFLFT